MAKSAPAVRTGDGHDCLVTAKVIAMPLSVMRDTGISSRNDWPSLRERFREEMQVHSAHCSGQLMAAGYQLYWLLYLPYRQGRNLFA